MGDDHVEIVQSRKNQQKRKMWSQNKEFLNGVKCQIESSYGCSQIPIRKNVLMIDDDRIVYQCGKHLVEYNLLHKKQSYLIKNIEDDDITAMNYYISGSDTLNMVVGLKGTKGFPCLKVLKKKSTNQAALLHPHVQQNSIIIDCAFINKGKNVISLVEEENKYCITIFGVQREKLIFTRDILTSQVSMIEVCQDQEDEFYLIGPQYFQVWKLNIQEKSLNDEPFLFKENLTNPDEYIIECCQIPDTEYMAFITNLNILYFYKQRKYKQTQPLQIGEIHLKEEQQKKSMNIMKNPVKQVSSQVMVQSDDINQHYANDQAKEYVDPYFVSSLAPLFNGFIVGFENIGVVNAYEMNKRTEELFLKGTFRINVQYIYRVLSISSSVQENIMTLCIQHAPRIIQVMDTKTKTSTNNQNNTNPNTPSHNQNIQNNNQNTPHNLSNQNNQSINFLPINTSQFNLQMSQNIIDSPQQKQKSILDNIQGQQNQQNSSNLPQALTPQAKQSLKKFNINNIGLNQQGELVHNGKADLSDLGRLDLYIFNYGIVDVISAAQKDAFEPLFTEGVHKGQILDIAFCPSKSIALTICDDKTLKTWEFSMQQGTFKCVHTTYFHENPLSVSLNPLSFTCAIGFREGQISFISQ